MGEDTTTSSSTSDSATTAADGADHDAIADLTRRRMEELRADQAAWHEYLAEGAATGA